MNPSDIELLNNLKIYCSPEIVAKYKHKQKKPQEWTRFYYYKQKRYKIPNENIQYDYEVSSTLNYNKNVFYKMTAMSNNDGYFDYYYKLKDELPNVVVKKSNRYGKSQATQLKVLSEKPSVPTCPDTGKFIINFQ